MAVAQESEGVVVVRRLMIRPPCNEPQIAPDGSSIGVSVFVSDEQVTLCIRTSAISLCWVNVGMQCEVL